MPAQKRPSIARIGPEDGALLRDLRLRSLVDAPDAFGNEPAEMRSRAMRTWERAARKASSGDGDSWFLAWNGATAIGLVQGRRRPPAELLIFSMWVDPPHRRRGVARALIDATEAWARGWDAATTILWVRRENAAAIAFYERIGFSRLHDGADAAAGARFDAVAMRRAIAQSGRVVEPSAR